MKRVQDRGLSKDAALWFSWPPLQNSPRPGADLLNSIMAVARPTSVSGCSLPRHWIWHSGELDLDHPVRNRAGRSGASKAAGAHADRGPGRCGFSPHQPAARGWVPRPYHAQSALPSNYVCLLRYDRLFHKAKGFTIFLEVRFPSVD
jgi:hypothetical protein